MYRSLVAALFCVAAQAAPTVAQKPPVPPRAAEISAPAELIKTVSAGTRTGKEMPREKRSATVAASQEESSQPDTRNMVFAALALMVGIAVRRYGVGRK